MNYAILGGTFNPIHIAHLIMAEYVYATGLFDKILIMPSGNPPHKTKKVGKTGSALDENHTWDDQVIDKKHRLNMCELVANHKDYFEVSTIEINREGSTYTVDTIEQLIKENEMNSYSLIIGADSLMNLDKWYQPERLFKVCQFVVIDRITNTDDEVSKKIQYFEEVYGGRFVRVDMPLIDISSTVIRQRIRSRKFITYLVDKAVESYIEDHDLYQVKDALSSKYRQKIVKNLKKQLSDKRFEHTMAVKDVAISLASRYGVDVNRAALAAMLHDCAKNLTSSETEKYCKKYKIKLTPTELSNPDVIHARLGAAIANDQYEIIDREILDAIAYHTTGRANMGILEKIIYIADYIEPGRKKAANLARYRQLAYVSLDQTMYDILKDTLAYLEQSDAVEIDTKTKEAFNYFEKLLQNNQSKE